MLFCLYLNFAFGTFKQTLDEFNSDPYSVYFLRNQENLHNWNKSSTPLLLYVPVPRTVLVFCLMIKFNVNRSNKCKVQFNEIRTSDTESVCYTCLKKNQMCQYKKRSNSLVTVSIKFMNILCLEAK